MLYGAAYDSRMKHFLSVMVSSFTSFGEHYHVAMVASALLVAIDHGYLLQPDDLLAQGMKHILSQTAPDSNDAASRLARLVYRYIDERGWNCPGEPLMFDGDGDLIEASTVIEVLRTHELIPLFPWPKS